MDYRRLVELQSPPSTYAIADLLNKEPGSVARVFGLTLERSFFIGTGLYLAGIRDNELIRGSLFASASITAWILADYWLQGQQR